MPSKRSGTSSSVTGARAAAQRAKLDVQAGAGAETTAKAAGRGKKRQQDLLASRRSSTPLIPTSISPLL